MNIKRFASARTCLPALLILALCPYAAKADELLKSYDIKAQSMDRALRDFAAQTEIQVAFSPDIVDGLVARAVEGDYAPESALQTLIDDSGLDYEFASEKLVVLRASQVAEDERGDSDPKNSSSQSVLMAQNASSQLSATTSGQSNEDGVAGIVSGRVVDARTGTNLKGALVTIEETGQSTSTNDLGEFRFPSVTAGYYTLRVSYLGYVEQTAEINLLAGAVEQRRFALIGGSELEEIVVFGQRSARAQALNIERTAPNSQTVLSADMLGNFNGTTISEALRRAPGVAFIPDENTGEGANIVFRGLEPDLNQVTLNGIRLLDGTGIGRAPDLSNILTEAVESVTINRTLLPSDESSGAGAVIEIETKGPLDRDERFASFGVEYGENGGDFGDEFGINGALSGRFGANRDFGISLSASYRESETTRVNYDVNTPLPEVLPLDENGEAPIARTSEVDPRLLFPFEEAFPNLYTDEIVSEQGASDVETLSLTGTVQKAWGDHTQWRLDGVYSEDRVARFSLSTRANVRDNYQLIPVDELGGEERYVYVTEDAFSGFFGPGIIGSIGRLVSGVPDQESRTLSLSFRGDTSVGQWDTSYGLGYSRSESENTSSYTVSLGNLFDEPRTDNEGVLADRSFLQTEALENLTSDGRIISVYPALRPNDDSFVLPLFSDQGFAFYNAIDNLPVGVRRFGGRKSRSKEYTVDYSLRRTFNADYPKYVEVGLNYTHSDFFSPTNSLANDVASGQGYFQNAEGAVPSDFGLRFAPNLLSQVGATGGFLSLDGGSVTDLVNGIPGFVESGLLIPESERERTDSNNAKTIEKTFAPYLEMQFDIGKLELIGGVRLESIEISSTSFTSPSVLGVNFENLLDPSDFGQFLGEKVTQTELLPRFLANYRFTDNVIFRGAYYVTASRPQLSRLTSQRRLFLYFYPFLSTNGDRPLLSVTQGNPDLKPAVTHNFGLDWEWFFDDVGVIKIAGFYKQIDDPLQATRVLGGLDVLPEDLVLPDIPYFNDLPDPLEVQVNQPINGEEDDRIWGAELTLERQLAFLPDIFNGLGIFTNYTYTDSEGTRRLRVSPNVDQRGFVEIEAPIFQAPEHQGTFGFTYNNYNVDATLFYTAQARRLSSIGDFGLDNYNEAIETLDFRLDYFREFGGTTVRFFLRGEDLLSGREDAFLQTSIGGDNGVPKYFTGATYFGGRSVFLGASATF